MTAEVLLFLITWVKLLKIIPEQENTKDIHIYKYKTLCQLPRVKLGLKGKY